MSSELGGMTFLSAPLRQVAVPLWLPEAYLEESSVYRKYRGVFQVNITCDRMRTAAKEDALQYNWHRGLNQFHTRFQSSDALQNCPGLRQKN